MEQSTLSRNAILFFIIALILVVGFYIGFSTGKNVTEKKTDQVLSTVFPKPPAIMKTLSGIVKSVNGASFQMELQDPADYLPHIDGTPQKKIVRTVHITGATTITWVDYTKPDKKGNPKRTVAQFLEILPGTPVSVSSNSNITSAENIDASSVELIRY